MMVLMDGYTPVVIGVVSSIGSNAILRTIIAQLSISASLALMKQLSKSMILLIRDKDSSDIAVLFGFQLSEDILLDLVLLVSNLTWSGFSILIASNVLSWFFKDTTVIVDLMASRFSDAGKSLTSSPMAR